MRQCDLILTYRTEQFPILKMFLLTFGEREKERDRNNEEKGT